MSESREAAWAARKAARGAARSCNPETEFTAGWDVARAATPASEHEELIAEARKAAAADRYPVLRPTGYSEHVTKRMAFIAGAEWQAGSLESLPTPPAAGRKTAAQLLKMRRDAGMTAVDIPKDYDMGAGEPEREALALIEKIGNHVAAEYDGDSGLDSMILELRSMYRREPEPREVRTADAPCGQRGWLEDDQDDDNPCVCGLPVRHDGLHACFEGCGGQWAGGTPGTEEAPVSGVGGVYPPVGEPDPAPVNAGVSAVASPPVVIDSSVRPSTPDVLLPSGGKRITVKRCCNGCNRELGDATAAEMDAAVYGGGLPDVRVECGCAA